MWFEVYEDEGGEWRWRLWSEGGRTVASSAAGHAAKVECLYDIALTMSSCNASIREPLRQLLQSSGKKASPT